MLLIVHHTVRDYDAWKPVFDGHESVRTKYGCRGHVIYRNADDPNELRVFSDWPSREQAEQFARDPSLAEAMQRGGVIGEPRITFVEEAERTQCAQRQAA